MPLTIVLYTDPKNPGSLATALARPGPDLVTLLNNLRKQGFIVMPLKPNRPKRRLASAR